MSQVATIEQLFRSAAEEVRNSPGGQELLRKLASEEALTPTEQYLLAVASVLFDPKVEPAEKKDESMRVLLLQADAQVQAETHGASPWAGRKGDSAQQKATKAGVRDYVVLTRVVEILRNLQTTYSINETELLREMERRRVDLFPPDGEWRDLKAIVQELNQGKVGSRARDIFRFTGQIGDAYEEAGIDAKEVAQIIQAHAGERNDGTSVLAVMATAASKVLKDHRLTPAEKTGKLREIAERAKELSVNKLEERYSNRLVPKLPYDEQAEDDGSTVFVFFARTGDQAELLRGRMGDAMIHVSDLGVDLFRPVTPGRVLKAQAAGDWAGLLKSAVLADPACRVVHAMMEAGPGPFDQEHFLRHSNLAPQDVRQALDDLARYGLSNTINIGARTFWSLKQP